MPRREGLDLALVAEAAEAVDHELLDVHGLEDWSAGLMMGRLSEDEAWRLGRARGVRCGMPSESVVPAQ